MHSSLVRWSLHQMPLDMALKNPAPRHRCQSESTHKLLPPVCCTVTIPEQRLSPSTSPSSLPYKEPHSTHVLVPLAPLMGRPENNGPAKPAPLQQVQNWMCACIVWDLSPCVTSSTGWLVAPSNPSRHATQPQRCCFLIGLRDGVCELQSHFVPGSNPSGMAQGFSSWHFPRPSS